MATITISNTGGNWNATGTWVGGVIPASTDDVAATATSGNLTVTANATIVTVNFTNYVATFTVNSGITVAIKSVPKRRAVYVEMLKLEVEILRVSNSFAGQFLAALARRYCALFLSLTACISCQRNSVV